MKILETLIYATLSGVHVSALEEPHYNRFNDKRSNYKNSANQVYKDKNGKSGQNHRFAHKKDKNHYSRSNRFKKAHEDRKMKDNYKRATQNYRGQNARNRRRNHHERKGRNQFMRRNRRYKKKNSHMKKRRGNERRKHRKSNKKAHKSAKGYDKLNKKKISKNFDLNLDKAHRSVHKEQDSHNRLKISSTANEVENGRRRSYNKNDQNQSNLDDGESDKRHDQSYSGESDNFNLDSGERKSSNQYATKRNDDENYRQQIAADRRGVRSSKQAGYRAAIAQRQDRRLSNRDRRSKHADNKRYNHYKAKLNRRHRRRRGDRRHIRRARNVRPRKFRGQKQRQQRYY